MIPRLTDALIAETLGYLKDTPLNHITAGEIREQWDELENYEEYLNDEEGPPDSAERYVDWLVGNAL